MIPDPPLAPKPGMKSDLEDGSPLGPHPFAHREAIRRVRNALG